MERAAKLLLWSCLIYQYSEVEGLEVPIGDEILSLFGGSSESPGPCINSAMALFGCEHRRVICLFFL